MDTVVNYEGAGACAICYSDDIYSIFILDFDFDASAAIDGFTEKLPILQIKAPESLSFCVLGSLLFMFDDSGGLYREYGSSKMYELDLGPYCSKSEKEFILDTSGIEKHRGRDMNAPKWNACAIATPDGSRILVCSRFIRCYHCYDEVDEEEIESERRDFEVYDPSNKTWFAIPQLVLIIKSEAPDLLMVRDDQTGRWITHYGRAPLRGCVGDCHLQIGVAFINNSNTFLIEFPMGAVFTFNLDSPQQSWKTYEGEIGGGGDDDFWFVDGVTIDPFSVRKGDVEHRFVIPPRIRGPCSSPCYWMTMLEYMEKQKCVPCIGMSWVDDYDTGFPHLAFDIFKVDTKMVARPTRIGSFKFVVPRKIEDFYVDSLFPITIMV